jgi:cyclic pyranopterin phosphate synthase
MVDVSGKTSSLRVARATGAINMRAETLEAIRANAVAKGDVLAVARVAGVLAAKRTADLIPLCHPLPLTDVHVELLLDEALPGVRAEATVKTVAPTGVEMEALVAVSLALATIYDMVKGVDRSMTIGEIVVVEKSK